jgi:DNA-binding MarR family transcriptional regulator
VGIEAGAAKDGPPERLWRLSTWLLSKVANRGFRLVVDRVGGAKTTAYYAVLATLDAFGPTSQATLGRRLGFDRSDIVAVLDGLEREGLAVRTPDDRDRRRNAITITPEGAHALRRLDDLVADAQEALLEPLSPAERRQLVSLLRRLYAHHAAPSQAVDDRERANG